MNVGDVHTTRTQIMEGASSCEFYMYENLQGEKTSNSEAWKNPFDKASDGPNTGGASNYNLPFDTWNAKWANILFGNQQQ